MASLLTGGMTYFGVRKEKEPSLRGVAWLLVALD